MRAESTSRQRRVAKHSGVKPFCSYSAHTAAALCDEKLCVSTRSSLHLSLLYTLCGVSQEAVTYPVAMSLGETISVTLVTPPVTLSRSWSLNSLAMGLTAGVGAFFAGLPFFSFLFFMSPFSFHRCCLAGVQVLVEPGNSLPMPDLPYYDRATGVTSLE